MRTEKITRTKEQAEMIKQFIYSHGFKTVADFSRNVGMERQNVSMRILGKCNPDIRMLLKWAIVLRCDITELLELFYPEEYKEYATKK